MSKKVIFVYVVFGFFVFSIWSFSDPNNNKDEFTEKVKIALRDVGNRLLLADHDSTSLIQPIILIEASKYRLSFENQLALEPGNLVTTIEQSLKKAKIPINYRVEVIQCLDNEVAYSFEITSNKETTIIPCSGRFLPIKCYTIELRFLNKKISFFDSQKNIFALLITSIFLFLMFAFRKRKKGVSGANNNPHATIGSFRFYPNQNKLVKEAIEINLSRKECQILEIFVANLNQVVQRDELTKKVWEDNGVIVGRSLDTYISKLRKKLIEDDSIKLTNIHGVGYKLEIQG